MRGVMLLTGLMLVLGVASGEWNTNSPQPWKGALRVCPTYHNLGSDYVAFTSLEASYIQYYAGDAAASAKIRDLALALARHCQIPAARVRPSFPYHNQSFLRIVWRPNRTPFDHVRPKGGAPTSWRVLIGSRGVVVQAKSDAGLRYALKVLLRVVEAASGPSLRRMVLEDSRDLVENSDLRTLEGLKALGAASEAEKTGRPSRERPPVRGREAVVGHGDKHHGVKHAG